MRKSLICTIEIDFINPYCARSKLNNHDHIVVRISAGFLCGLIISLEQAW